MDIILASQSPSRKLLFDRAGIEVEVLVSGVDETVPADHSPKKVVEELSRRKAEAVSTLCENKAIIAADSVVLIDDKILGKPSDLAHAREMLAGLSGRTHQIYTGVSIVAGGKRETFSQVTDVTFYELSDEELDEYISSGESLGKAGSYGIEGKGVMLIKEICGDYSNIVGLPLAETMRRLKIMCDEVEIWT